MLLISTVAIIPVVTFNQGMSGAKYCSATFATIIARGYSISLVIILPIFLDVTESIPLCFQVAHIAKPVSVIIKNPKDHNVG